MNFETYINQAWADHATQTSKVAEDFLTAANLVETNEQLAQLVNLITHVMGEHLAKWNDGVEILVTLKAHPQFLSGTEAENAINRSLEALKIGNGQTHSLNSFSTSDQIRIMAVAALALSERDAMKAKSLLTNSLELASGLDQKDPANRALAVTGNNLACALEEKSERDQAETDLMILAAQTARQYWELAGTWLEVSRAEYRLSMTYLKAKDINRAFQHAQTCVELCQENKAGELDMFYCYEALALVEKARGNGLGFVKAVDQVKHYFKLLSVDLKSWCEKSLQRLI